MVGKLLSKLPTWISSLLEISYYSNSYDSYVSVNLSVLMDVI